MIICQICNRECKGFKGITSHINKSHKDINIKDYYDKYLKKESEGICLECNKETSFLNINKGYNNYCSNKCSSNSKEVRNKYINNCQKKYNCDNVFQLEEIKEKSKQVNLKNLNVEHPLQNKDIQIKRKNTYLERYGVEYPSQNENIKEKQKQTCLKKYGNICPLQNIEIKKKTKKTNLSKYNREYFFQTDNFKNKQIQTKRKIFYINLLNSDRLKNLVIPLFTLEDYKGSSREILYPFKCVKCSNIFEDHLNNGRIPRCFKCFSYIKSNIEYKCYEFLSTLLNEDEIIQGNRNILEGKELDIYIPSKNLAIELDGLYWHSELNGSNKNYHLNKTLQCKEKGIQLLHIFEDEWIEKQEIVKSIIRSKLGLIENKIYARKCILKEVNKNDSFNFLDSNHIQGFINGKHIGLYYNNELTSILTYDNSKCNSNYEIEILRFCNKLNTIVVGGLSKLIKYIKSDSIITYADLRYGNGHSYEKCGFKKISKSNPSYYYLDKNYNRIKNKNIQSSDYDKIWDCGCNVYIFNKEL